MRLGIRHSNIKKEYVRMLRKNKKWKPFKINKFTKYWKSMQFQKQAKSTMMIPRQIKGYHIQINIDKHGQLVSFMRVKIKRSKLIKSGRVV